MILYCDKCKEHTQQDVLPWQTGEGIFGAVSTRCVNCGELIILTLKDGLNLNKILSEDL